MAESIGSNPTALLPPDAIRNGGKPSLLWKDFAMETAITTRVEFRSQFGACVDKESTRYALGECQVVPIPGSDGQTNRQTIVPKRRNAMLIINDYTQAIDIARVDGLSFIDVLEESTGLRDRVYASGRIRGLQFPTKKQPELMYRASGRRDGCNPI